MIDPPYRFAISGNGRYVSFASGAADLVADDTNGVADIFVRDRLAGLTRRISTSAAGVRQHGRAARGIHLQFPELVPGDTNNATDLFVRDR